MRSLKLRMVLIFFVVVVLQCYFFNRNKMKVDFTLKTVDSSYILSNSKKLRLVYFGFLSCPDICPTTFQILAKSIESLSEEEKRKIEILFIDIDPKRDTFPQMQKYLDHFYPGIIPLTGSEKELKEVAKKLNAFFEEVPIESEMGYTIDHSTRIYVIDKDSYYLDSIPHGLPIEVVTQYIRKNLD